MQTDPHLYVEADACPVKPEAVKAAERHGQAADNIGDALATRELMTTTSMAS